MTIKRCDGCGRDMNTVRVRHMIEGRRTPESGMGLDPLPNGEFDWCEDCGKIAFAAVRAARRG